MNNPVVKMKPAVMAGLALVMLLGGRVQAAQAETVRFAVIGDYGVIGPGEQAVADMIDTWKVEFIVTTGDNSYPVSDALSLRRNLKPYMKWISANPAENRFWPAVGNHDYLPGLGFRFYLNFFKALNGKWVYTLKKGPVQFFMIDSHPRAQESGKPFTEYLSDQKKWLKKELAASKAAWKVVVFHHPSYSSSNHGSAVWMQWNFEALGADVVVTGHEHAYQRRQGVGVPVFVNGIGGNPKFYGCCLQPRPIPGDAMCFTDHFGAQLGVADGKTMTLTMISTDWPEQPLDTCAFTKAKGKTVMSCKAAMPAPEGLKWETCKR